MAWIPPEPNAFTTMPLGLDQLKSVPGLQRSPACLLVIVNTTNVVQRFNLLARYVTSVVPRLCQREKGLIVHVTDVILPFLLGIMSRFNGFQVLCLHFLDEVCDEFNLQFKEDGTVGECRRCW
jgi:hypothetical protein